MSYTTFEYSPIKLTSDTLITEKRPFKVSVTVKNTGTLDGQEVVELYTRDMVASITPSVKRLRRFEKIDLKAGESKTVDFILTKTDLAFINAELKSITEEGTSNFNCKSKATFYCK